MADETKLIISIEAVLKNLDRTLAGLSKVEAQLKRISTLKPGTSGATLDRTALSIQRLAVQTQELANRQLKAQVTADKLALSQLKLEQSLNRAAAQSVKQAKIVGANADAHVKAFKAIETGQAKQRKNADEVARINAQTARQTEQQEQIRERAARTLASVQVREAKRGADAFSKGIEDNRRRAEDFTRQVEAVGNSLRSVGQGLTSFGFVLSAAVTAPLVALGVNAVQASVTLDSLKRGLTTIAGSASAAEVQLKRLTEIAKLPGIGFEEAIQGSIRLQAVGFSARDAEKALKEFSNAIAIGGGGRDELARVTVQLGQLAAKGKVLSQDLRPIIEAAPAVGTALKKAFGTVNADDIAALTGSSEEFFSILIKELELLPRAAGGARNTFDNFRDSVFRASTALGDVLLPILTKLIDVALPVIEALAKGFRALPFSIQLAIVAVGAFAAVLGPVLILVGQFVLATGRLAVGLSQLTLAVRGNTAAMLGLAAAEEGAAVATNTLNVALKRLLIGTGVGLALVALGTILAEVFLGSAAASETATNADEEAIKARNEHIKVLKEEIDALEDVAKRTAATADDQKRIADSTASLNEDSRLRNSLLGTEKEKLDALIAAKREELQIEQALLAQDIADSVKAVTEQIDKQTEATKRLTAAELDFKNAREQERQPPTPGGRLRSGQLIPAGANVTLGLEAERRALDDVKQSRKEVTEAEVAAGRELEVLRARLNTNNDGLIAYLRSIGKTDEEIERARRSIEAFAASQDKAAGSVRNLTSALSEQSQAALKAGAAAEELEKTRRDLVSKNIALAREASSSLAGALKFMRAFIAANPELAEAVRKQAQLAGKSIDEFLSDEVGLREKSGTALRNAQERQDEQRAALQAASQARELAKEDAKNDELLRASETSFHRQLSSYREFLEARATLTESALNDEILKQAALVKKANDDRIRLEAKASLPGIPPVERLNRQTAALKAQEDAAKAEAKLAELESKRRDINHQLQIELADLARQQEADTRQLTIDYEELTGQVEAAFRAQTIERFRQQLEDLGRDQEAISKRLASTVLTLTAEEREQLEIRRRRNKEQIDSIGFLKQELDAQAVLKGQEAAISLAKQKQSDLEEQLRIDVEFRGKTEQEAIRERLAGEDALREKLLASQVVIEGVINRLKQLGVDVPRELGDFVNDVTLQVQQLGRLPFSEQFRLVGIEFDRANDERLRRIEDVNRAVDRRVLSEQQGIVQIRNINRQYTSELERQLQLLEQIAEESHNPDLLRQVHSLQDALADANTELEDFATELQSVSIDALQGGFEDFFASLTDRTKSAKDKLLDLVNSVANSIERFIAKRLSERLIESIFGSGKLPGPLGSLLGGGGGQGAVGGIGQAAGASQGAALTTAATTAGTALISGGTAAATALTTGGVTASTTIVTALATAAASFSAAVIAAGAAFAASVAASSAVSAGSSAFSGLGSFGSGFEAAEGAIFSAKPGGRLVNLAEAGHAEAVLTTDPRHALKQLDILRRFLRTTRGLGGRVPQLAEGAFVTPRQAEMNLLGSIQRTPLTNAGMSQLAIANGSGGSVRLRQIFVDDHRDLRNWATSSEGEEVTVQHLIRNRPLLKRLVQ